MRKKTKVPGGSGRAEEKARQKNTNVNLTVIHNKFKARDIKALDKEWFKQHPNREFRVRRAFWPERRDAESSLGKPTHVVIRKIPNMGRTNRDLYLTLYLSFDPLNNEYLAYALFHIAITFGDVFLEDEYVAWDLAGEMESA